MLESHFGKLDILEFYLNQVPYKANRRGIVQAAHYYFDRDIDTLNQKEMLALAVLVRSPRWLDPKLQSNNIDRAIANLTERLYNAKFITKLPKEITGQSLSLLLPSTTFNAQHFVEYASAQVQSDQPDDKVINTTITD